MAIWLGVAVYVGILVGASRANVTCIWLSIVPPAGIFLYTAPNVIYNFWEFATDNPIYLDSPGTILAVAVYGVFLTVPSGLALGAYWPQLRKRFLPDDH
ncbi:MAG: hypothetical protein ACK45Y_03285 [Betaproteobacteria bacterium]